jgi:NO-binding membrane sensor protein with MHYT domain
MSDIEKIVWLCTDIDSVTSTQGCPYKEGEELSQTWQMDFVLLSWAYAVSSAFTAGVCFDRLPRVRTATWYWLFLVGGGVAFGGSWVWMMHFSGLRALHLGRQDDMPMKIEVFNVQQERKVIGLIKVDTDLGWTVLSFMAITGFCIIGVFLITYRNLQKPDGEEWKPNQKMIAFVTFALCLGVHIMHYGGMQAQVGYFDMEWEVAPMIGVGLLAIVVCWVGLTIFFNEYLVPSVRNRLISGLVVGTAVSCVHYTGMYTVKYKFNPNKIRDAGFGASGVQMGNLYSALVTASFVKSIIMVFVAWYDGVVMQNAFHLVGLYKKRDEEQELMSQPGSARSNKSTDINGLVWTHYNERHAEGAGGSTWLKKQIPIIGLGPTTEEQVRVANKRTSVVSAGVLGKTDSVSAA